MTRGSAVASILRGAAPLAALETLTMLLSVLLVPYLARTLGTAGFGRYAFGVAAAGAMGVLVDYGFNQLGLKEVARADAAGPERARIFWGIQRAKLLIAIAAIPVAAVAAWSLDLFAHYGSALGGALLGVVAALTFPAWYLQGQQRYRTLAASLSAARVACAAATLMWVRAPEDAVWAVVLQAGTAPLAGVFSLCDAGWRRSLAFQPAERTRTMAWLRNGGPLFVSTAAISMYTTCVPLILGILTSPATVGLFSVADKARVAGQTLLAPLTAAAFPALSRRVHDDRTRGLVAARQVMLVQVGVAVVATLAILLFAEPLMALFAGPSFGAAVPTMRILALCLVFTALTNALGIQVMLPLNMDRPFATILATAAGIGVATSWVLCPVWQDRGAAVAVLLTEVLIVVGLAGWLHHRGVSLGREAGR